MAIYLIILTVTKTPLIDKMIDLVPLDARLKVSQLSDKHGITRFINDRLGIIDQLSSRLLNHENYPVVEQGNRSAVLAQSVSQDLTFDVNIASKFAENASFEKDVEVLGVLTAANLVTNGNITAQSITSRGAITGTTGTFTGNVTAASLLTNATTFNLVNTNATTLNIGGAATTVSLGATSGTSTVNNDLTVKGKLTVNGTSTLTGDVTASGALGVSGNATFGNITKINGVTYSFPSTQGAANTALTNNGSGTLTWAFPLTSLSSVTGVLGISNGGTNNSTAYTAGSVIFSDGTKLTQDNSNLFWNDTDNKLGILTTSPTSTLSVGASSQFQVNSTGNVIKINNVTYSWPTSNATGANYVLSSNISGDLSWSPVSGVGAVTASGTPLANQIAYWDGSSTIAGSSNFTWNNGTSTFSATGTTNLLGSVTFGSAITDLVTFTGRLASGTSIIPVADLGSDLGTSLLRFNNIYAANLNIDSGLTFSGQLLVTYNPTDTTFEQSSIRVNVTTPAADEQMLGIGQAGEERATIDAEGDLTLGYDGAAGSSIPVSSNPLNIYGHNTTPVFTVDASGNISTTNQAIAWTLNNAANALNFDSNTLSIDALNNRVGIGDSSPASLLTVGNGDLFQINSNGQLTITPNTTGTYTDYALETEWTAGDLINADYASATTQTGDIVVADFDFDTNFTGAADFDFTGIRMLTPDLSQTTDVTTNYKGFNISSAGSLTSNSSTSLINWSGVDITMPNVTNTLGNIYASGIKGTNGTISNGVGNASQYIFNAAASGVGAGELDALKVNDITGGAGTEYALNIGTGWDYGIMTEAGTNGTAYIELASDQTSGTIVDIGSTTLSTTLTGQIIGLNLDMSNSYVTTNQTVYGQQIFLHGGTNTGSGTYYQEGIYIYSNSLAQTTAGGTSEFYGVVVTNPGITQTTGAVNAYGIEIDTGSITTNGKQIAFNAYLNGTTIPTAGTLTGFRVSPRTTGIAAGTEYGMDIGTISSPGAGTEVAINVGTGWETLLSYNGTTVINGNGGIVGGQVTANSLDFAQFQDTLDLDANTSINLDNDVSQFGLSLVGDLSVGARSTDALNISIANNVTNDFTGDLLELNLADTGSSGRSLYISNLGSGNSLRIDDEGSDTTPFVVDASGKVGIGTATPSQALTLASALIDSPQIRIENTYNGSDSTPEINIYRDQNGSPVTNWANIGRISFSSLDSGSNETKYSYINGGPSVTTNGSEAGFMDFYVTNAGAAQTRLSIQTSKVQVNGDNYDVDFQVRGDTDPLLFFANAGTDRVGVGTDVPGSKLDVVGNNTTTSSFTQFTVNGAQSNIASLGSTNFYGANFAPSYGAGTNPMNLLLGVQSNPLNNATGTGVNALANMWGFYSNPGNVTTGTVTDLRGFYAAPYNFSSGTVSLVYGFASQPNNVSTGTIGTLYGFYAAAPLNAGGGTISNKYAFVSEADAGNVGIGTTTPTLGKLQILTTDNMNAVLTAGAPGLYFDENDTTNQNWQFQLDGGSLLFRTNNDAFSSASTKFTLTQTGRLGIGGTPNEALDIVGNATMSGTLGFKAIFPTDVPTCDVTAKGKIYYDGGRNQHYFCNGTNWRSLVGLQDHARQDITTNNTVHNQIVRKGWNYVTDTLNDAFYGTTTVTYGITFDDIPIVTMTPAGYKSTSPAPTALSDCTGASVAIPGGNEIVSQIRSLSTTTFVTEIGASLPTAASANSDHKWCFTWVAVGTYAAGADLAEYYKSTEKLEPGDVVAISKTEDKKVNKSGGSYDKNAIGIVSTSPGQVLGDEDGKSSQSDTYPIALAGRVPVKVSLQGGVIERGDPLTTSSIPGVAMKATGSGPIIGRAMERFDGTTTVSTLPYTTGKIDANDPELKELSNGVGKVMAFIDNSWWGETPQAPQSETTLAISNITDFSNADFLMPYISKSDTNPTAFFAKFSDVKSSLFNDEISQINTLNSGYLSLSTTNQEREDEIQGLTTSIASVSAQLANIEADVELLKSSQLVATASANILGTATDSASLTSLSVLKDTILADTVINGKLNVGLMSFDNINNSIDAVGVLKLQALALDSIQFENGAIEMDINGNLKINKGIIVGNDEMRGSVTLSAGHNTAEIIPTTPWSNPPKSIIITPSFVTSSAVIKLVKEGATVQVEQTSNQDQTIYWVAIW